MTPDETKAEGPVRLLSRFTRLARLAKPDAPSTGAFLRLFGCVNAAFFVALLAICRIAQVLTA